MGILFKKCIKRVSIPFGNLKRKKEIRKKRIFKEFLNNSV